MRYGFIDISYDGFDWDNFNLEKVKDRVPIEIIEQFFKHELLLRADPKHSLTEERFIAMGVVHQRLLFVVYTIRQKEAKLFIRVISSRYVHKNSQEEELYEKAKKIFEKA